MLRLHSQILLQVRGEGDTFYYYIKVFQEPDAKGKVTESRGAKEKIFLKEGHNTIKFVRHTAWISAVTINGKSPYGDDIVIDINKDKKAHFKVTVKMMTMTMSMVHQESLQFNL